MLPECPTCGALPGWACRGRVHADGYHPARMRRDPLIVEVPTVLTRIVAQLQADATKDDE